MKNGFTRTQIEIIKCVEKYLSKGNSFDWSVMLTHSDLGFEDWYIKETYLSYKTMVIRTK